MKKIALSLAGILAAAAFAPEASALPVFARQTGMACNACHYQHFPLLNAFGRAFKSSGFTLMGAQGRIEGERASIPDTLNMAVLTSMGYVKSNMNPDTSGLTKNSGNGVVYFPGTNGEASLFFGGRVSDSAGFLSEVTLAPTAGFDSGKLPILYDVGNGVRVGAVPFSTNGQGASYGFELLNTGANAVQQMTNTPGNANADNGDYANAFSAQQYISTATNADGVALVAAHTMGFVNLTKFQQTGIANAQASSLGSTYLRVAGLFDLAGWDAGAGIQYWGGASLNAQVPAVLNVDGTTTAGTAAVMTQTKATAIDAQMQGDLGSLPAGFYVSYARAPVGTDGLTNAYSLSADGAPVAFTRSSFNIAGEIGVVPQVVTLGAAIRRGKSGVDDGTGANATDNAIFLTATYKIQQNMLARLSWVTQSGSYWDLQSVANPGETNAQAYGSKSTTVNLYVLF